jgi:hypothetical protein
MLSIKISGMKVSALFLFLFHFTLPAQAGADTWSLAEELQPYVKQLSQPIYTFHYATREAMKIPTTGPLDLNSTILQNHVRDWANYFWDLSQPGDTGMVRGFYLATDPVVSRDFGKSNWILYRVELPAGTRYLDVHPLVSGALEQVSPAVQAKLLAAGCNETKWKYVLYKSFDKNCRKIALQTLKDLQVTLIDYDWVSADYTFCTSRPNDAFILLKPEAIAPADIKIFYAEMIGSSADEQAQRSIESFFLRVQPNAEESGSTAPETSPQTYALWRDLNNPAISDEDFKNYLTAHIYGCQSAKPLTHRE